MIPIALTRTYQQKDSRMRAFGVGTSHEYEMFLVGATNPWTYVELILADGARLRYERISAGSSFSDAVFEHTTTPGRFYKSTIRYAKGVNVGWDLRLRDGTVYSFPDSEGASTPRRAALVRIRDRHGSDLVLTRDANWNLTQITSQHGRWIKLTYDTLHRITRAEDTIGRVVLYTYDTIGRLETVTDVANGVTRFTYDAQHQMRTITDPRNITYLTNEYDANGRVILETQADSTTFQFAYTLDASGRVVQTDVTNPRGFVRRVTFNGSGYMLTNTRAFGTTLAQTTTYVRQAGTNLPLSVTDALNRKTTYAYDVLGNVTRVTRLADTPDAVTTTFTYEPAFSQLTSLTDPLTHATTFAYDARGNLLSATDANGNRRTITYDTLGRPTVVADGAGNSTALSYLGGDLFQVIGPVGDTITRGMDGAGRLTQFTSGRGNLTRYEYNALNQITRVIDAANGHSVLAYDPNGNLLSLTDARTKTTNYTYDAMDRAATRTDPVTRGESHAFDANGNLRQVTDRKGQVITYAYDALDRLSQAADGGAVQTEYTYEPFGMTAASGSASTNALQFTGRENDGTGGHYYRARYYDPTTSRFLSEDPLTFGAGDMNLYSYALNAPATLKDPTGEFVVPWHPPAFCQKGGIAGRKGNAWRVVSEAILGMLCTPSYDIPFTPPILGPFTKAESEALRLLFGKGAAGAKDLLRRLLAGEQVPIPENVTLETLQKYREIAQRAIEKGLDKAGTQVPRKQAVDIILRRGSMK